MKTDLKRLQKAGIDGTYFQDSWVVAKDGKGDMLLHTDVLISEEKIQSLQEWIDEFTDIGSMPSFIKPLIEKNDEKLIQSVSQSVILSKRSKNRITDEDQKTAAALLKKFLQRGKAPLPTIGVEKESLKINKINKYLEKNSTKNPEIDFWISSQFPGRVNNSDLLKFITKRRSFELDNEYLLQRNHDQKLLGSEIEEKFFCEWLPDNCGKEAPQWFVPQASLDRLLETHGIEDDGARRVDFLFYHPNSEEPLVVEIDGKEHESAESVDQERDNSLRSVGIKVIRIKNEELLNGTGPELDSLKIHLNQIITNPIEIDNETQNLFNAFLDCQVASKIQYGLAKSIEYGWLEGSCDWLIEIEGSSDIAFSAFEDLMQLLIGLDKIYGTNICPNLVDLKSKNEIKKYKLENGELVYRDDQELNDPSLFKLRIDTYNSNHHTIALKENESPDMVIRPAFLPVKFSVDSSYFIGRRKIEVHKDDASSVFLIFLQHLFRKKEFREHQSNAVYNALNQEDSIVLLPTGAGKSIIYQLAGLLMPGVTLVVDPLTALIEDQIEGLSNYGIDRAVGLTSMKIPRNEKDRLMKGIERGEYHFILHSPERLQIPSFRSTLRALVETSLINLAVIDEAHCVSEWGHDFRPSYLNLSDNLKNFAKDRSGEPPPLIALTGTASRAVLRDVLTELHIDRSNSNLLIRPDSFDREELIFKIARPERVDDTEAVLRGTLNALPEEFGLPRSEFYRSSGRDTKSGIIFVPFVNGRTHGIMNTLDEVRGSTKTNVTFYSGGAPRGLDKDEWDIKKRQNIIQFKQNLAPILISTKAFGMGIDKPNIRYTIHLGMPGSLEAFYQEAGRAGRDRDPAHARVIFTEFDQDRTDNLLDPSIDLEELRERYDESTANKKMNDDITRVLWFHLNNFSGEEREIEMIGIVIDEIGSFDSNEAVEIPFWKDKEKEKWQEKAIYRLVKVGVIKDYEKEWGSRLYRVYTKAFELEECKQNLLDYVQDSQPGRLKIFSDELHKIDYPEGIKPCITKLSRMLISFTYDQIERSRRRSIQESILLARNAKNDSEIRSRILYYLQEGLGKESFVELLEQTDVELSPWRDIAEKIHNPVDAGEIRGLSIRSLESFPDHPGLLFVRAISEIMCSDRDVSTTEQVIYSSFKYSSTRYDIDEEDVIQTIKWMADIASIKTKELSLPLAFAFYQADSDGYFNSSYESEKIFENMNDPTINAVSLSFKTMKLVDEIQNSVIPTLSEFKDPEILTLIG